MWYMSKKRVWNSDEFFKWLLKKISVTSVSYVVASGGFALGALVDRKYVSVVSSVLFETLASTAVSSIFV